MPRGPQLFFKRKPEACMGRRVWEGVEEWYGFDKSVISRQLMMVWAISGSLGCCGLHYLITR